MLWGRGVCVTGGRHDGSRLCEVLYVDYTNGGVVILRDPCRAIYLFHEGVSGGVVGCYVQF